LAEGRNPFPQRLAEFGEHAPAGDPMRSTNGPDHRQQESGARPEAVTIISKPVRERDRESLWFAGLRPSRRPQTVGKTKVALSPARPDGVPGIAVFYRGYGEEGQTLSAQSSGGRSRQSRLYAGQNRLQRR
jgi:hypothetical protein